MAVATIKATTRLSRTRHLQTAETCERVTFQAWRTIDSAQVAAQTNLAAPQSGQDNTRWMCTPCDRFVTSLWMMRRTAVTQPLQRICFARHVNATAALFAIAERGDRPRPRRIRFGQRSHAPTRTEEFLNLTKAWTGWKFSRRDSGNSHRSRFGSRPARPSGSTRRWRSAASFDEVTQSLNPRHTASTSP